MVIIQQRGQRGWAGLGHQYTEQSSGKINTTRSHHLLMSKDYMYQWFCFGKVDFFFYKINLHHLTGHFVRLRKQAHRIVPSRLWISLFLLHSLFANKYIDIYLSLEGKSLPNQHILSSYWFSQTGITFVPTITCRISL